MALKITERAVRKFNGTTQVAFELNEETIARIGKIIMALVAEFKNCQKTPDAALPQVVDPGTTEVAVVKRNVRKQLGFWKNLFQGDKYVKAVVDAGKESNLEEVKEAFRSR